MIAGSNEVIDVTGKSRPPSVGPAAEAAGDAHDDLIFDDDSDAMLTAALTASLRTGNAFD